MSQVQYQAALCRAYADGAFRAAVRADDPGWLRDYDLSDVEAERLPQLFRRAGAGMTLFIEALAGKHADALVLELSHCVKAFGELTVRKAWVSYYCEHRTGLMRGKLEEAANFLDWSVARGIFAADHECAHDILRYDAAVIALRIELAAGPVSPPAHDADVKSSLIAKSPCRVVSLGSVPQSWFESTSHAASPTVVVVYAKPSGAVRGARVGQLMLELLELCDGSRTASGVVGEIKARATVADADLITSTIDKLIEQGVLRSQPAGQT